MASPERPFRFGVQISEIRPRAAWVDQAQRAEALGYDILLVPDHFGNQFAVGPALAAAAAATTTLRIGTFVLQNDLRHPTLVAKEAATLDVLSDGRFELGLGAGGSWMPDYEQTGIPFDLPRRRVGRLEESLSIITGLWAEEPLTFAGRHYTITALDGRPKPIQRPRPPILVAGGGPRMLSVAAREADIVSILPTMLPGGGQFRMEESAAEVIATKIGLLHRLAGARLAELELNVLIQQVRVTDDAPGVSEELSQLWPPLTPKQVRETPFLLIGTVDEIVETLRTRRANLGISYVVVFEHDMEAFAPVVARLIGV